MKDILCAEEVEVSNKIIHEYHVLNKNEVSGSLKLAKCLEKIHNRIITEQNKLKETNDK